ncbi:MAG: hypothetical protein NC453_13865 [Muribaculum sp.]|nr:hypothetical protein [Muribaculum sp.]
MEYKNVLSKSKCHAYMVVDDFFCNSCIRLSASQKFMAKHVAGEEKQNFFSLITMLVVVAVVVTLSVIFFP